MDSVLTTGRSPGDTGPPTFVGYDEKSKSRPDHVLVSKALYAHVHHTKIAQPHWLDHCFQSITFATDNHVPEVEMRLQHDPMYGPEGHFLRLKPDRAVDCVRYLEQDTPARQRLYRVVRNEDVEQTWTCFRSWLVDAAVQTGMTASGTKLCKRPAQRERAAWFDDLYQKKKKLLLSAVMRGEDTHVREQLQREYRAYTQICKRRFTNSDGNANQTGSTQQRNVRLWTGAVSAMDHLIPLGGNAHPPGPRPFHIPDDNWFPTTFPVLNWS
jgi:hypothetical protein